MSGGDSGTSLASLDLYFRDIAREPLLSREEEASLARRARVEGDRAALDRLVTCNLRFVVSVAKEYRGRGLPLEDLINQGNLGLLRAAERFDEGRGVRFVSYAVWWIRQAILAALEDAAPPALGSPVRRSAPPRRSAERAARGARTRHLGRRQGARRGDRCPAPVLSLDARTDADGGLPLQELLPDRETSGPERVFRARRLRRLLDGDLAFLPEREETVLRAYFGLDGPPRSLGQIGRELGVSRERARQLKSRALSRMRRGHRRRELEELAE